MKIDHVAIYVDDLEGAKYFFTKFFHAVSNELYHNPKTGLRTYFLSFPDGGRVEIMNHPAIQSSFFTPFHQGYIHLAISVGSKELVGSVSLSVSEGSSLKPVDLR